MSEITVIGDNKLQNSTEINKDIFNRWLEYLDCKPKTVQTYTRAIRQFLYFLSENSITQPTRESVIFYKHSLTDQGLKPTTVKAYIVAVKQFFKWTETEGIYKNIADHIKTDRLDKGFKKDYLTAKQAGHLLENAANVGLKKRKGIRDYAILYLMLTTGLRTIEVARANIDDLRPLADRTVLYVQGKGHVERTEYVKIEPEVEEAIREYLKTRANATEKEPLFASVSNRNNNKRLAVGSISRIVKVNLRESGYNSDRLTAHSLRHTAATLNLLNGGTTEETQQLLRHASINTTLIYSHNLERMNNNSESRITTAISTARRKTTC